ncbi:hypothetical protein PC120_g19532 [Phytophthora cactorum]|nr:hypothetical protein PC120_g19532 [Phytophthora cactorum]
MEEVGPVCTSSDAYLTFLTTGAYTTYLKTGAYMTYAKAGTYTMYAKMGVFKTYSKVHDVCEDGRVRTTMYLKTGKINAYAVYTMVDETDAYTTYATVGTSKTEKKTRQALQLQVVVCFIHLDFSRYCVPIVCHTHLV